MSQTYWLMHISWLPMGHRHYVAHWGRIPYHIRTEFRKHYERMRVSKLQQGAASQQSLSRWLQFRNFPDSIHTRRPGVRVGVRVRVWGRVRVRDYVLGRFTQNPCVVLEPHALHTKYNLFDTVAYLFLYMACIGGS